MKFGESRTYFDYCNLGLLLLPSSLKSKPNRSAIRYNVRRSILRIFAALTLFPRVSLSTEERCRFSTSSKVNKASGIRGPRHSPL